MKNASKLLTRNRQGTNEEGFQIIVIALCRDSERNYIIANKCKFLKSE
jgi:hypothetical protein